MFASPISIPEYLAGLVATAVITSSAALLGMILLAAVAFGFSMASVGAMAAPFVLILLLFGVSLGIAAAAMVLRLGPAGEWLVWPIPAVIGPFAGVFYPIATLPLWMRPVSHILPPSYVFEAVRAVVGGRPVAPTDVVLATVLAIAWLLAAGALFAWVFRQVIRTGLLARYSAETVN
jgi:ABC-2 type transport system permease protein